MVHLTRSTDVVPIPTAPNSVEIEATARLPAQMGAAGADMERVRVVITETPPVGNVGQATRDELRAAGLGVCETVGRRYTAHERAYEGSTLGTDAPDPRSENAWADILSLTVEVC